MNYPSELQQKMVAASAQSQCLGSGLGVAIQRPETEIESVIKRTDNAVSRLHSRLDVLYDRLHPVTVPADSCTVPAAGSDCMAMGVMSPLGNGIRSIEQQIDNAVDRLELLLRCLAL